MKKTGKGSWEQFWLTYKNKPGSLAVLICVILAAAITVGVLFSLIIYILVNGVVHLKPELFAWEYNTSNMSMMPAIISTVYITALSLLMAVPVGIFSAIYLVEYAKRGSKLVKVIRTTTETLQGIPSIVYGLFGYILFVITLGWSYSMPGRIGDAGDHDPAADHPNNRRGTDFCAGFLPGRKFRTGRRQIADGFQDHSAVCCAGDPGRCDPCHWQDRRRKCCIDLHIRNGSTGSGQSVRFCKNPFGSHVRTFVGRTLYE